MQGNQYIAQIGKGFMNIFQQELGVFIRRDERGDREAQKRPFVVAIRHHGNTQ